MKMDEARAYLEEYEMDSLYANMPRWVITVNDAMDTIGYLTSCEGCEYHPLNSNTKYEAHCDSCSRNCKDNYKAVK